MSLPARERDGGRKIEAKPTKRQNKHQWVGGGVTRYSIGTVSGRRRPWGCAKLVWLHAGLSGSGWGERERNEGGGRKGGTEERRTTSLLFRSSFRGKGSVVVCSEGRALAHCGIQQRWTAPPHFHSWVVLHGLRTDLREHKRIHEFPTRRSELERRFWPCGGTRRAW